MKSKANARNNGVSRSSDKLLGKNTKITTDDLVINDVNDVNEISTTTKEKPSKIFDKYDDDTVSENEAKEMLDDPMDVVPPNFDLWRIHRDANTVKNIPEKDDDGVLYDDKEDFWQWWQLPTSKVAPPYKLWENVLSLEDLGSGFPLYFEFK